MVFFWEKLPCIVICSGSRFPYLEIMDKPSEEDELRKLAYDVSIELFPTILEYFERDSEAQVPCRINREWSLLYRISADTVIL